MLLHQQRMMPPQMTDKYTTQVRYLYNQIGGSVPIDSFVGALIPEALNVQNPHQFYAPVRFTVQVCGGVSSPSGAIRLDVPARSNQNWLQDMRQRFSRMVGIKEQQQDLEFRTVTGKSLDTVNVDALEHVGKLHVFVGGRRLLLPKMPVIPIEYSVNKEQKIREWYKTMQRELPEMIAKELKQKQSRMSLETALRPDGSVEHLIRSHLESASVDWQEFVRTHHMNSPSTLPAQVAEECKQAVARTMLAHMRKFIAAAAPKINQYVAVMESARFVSELAPHEEKDAEHYKPLLQTVEAPTPTTDAFNAYDMFEALVEDTLSSPVLQHEVCNTIFTRALPIESCRWDDNVKKTVPSSSSTPSGRPKDDKEPDPKRQDLRRDDTRSKRLPFDEKAVDDAYQVFENMFIDLVTTQGIGNGTAQKKKKADTLFNQISIRLDAIRERFYGKTTGNNTTIINLDILQKVLGKYRQTFSIYGGLSAKWAAAYDQIILNLDARDSNGRLPDGDIQDNALRNREAKKQPVTNKTLNPQNNPGFDYTSDDYKLSDEERSVALVNEAIETGDSKTEIRETIYELMDYDIDNLRTKYLTLSVEDATVATMYQYTVALNINLPKNDTRAAKDVFYDAINDYINNKFSVLTTKVMPSNDEQLNNLIKNISQATSKTGKGKELTLLLKNKKATGEWIRSNAKRLKDALTNTAVQLGEIMNSSSFTADTAKKLLDALTTTDNTGNKLELADRLVTAFNGISMQLHPWNAQIHHTLQPVAGTFPTYYNVLHTKQDMTSRAPYVGDSAATYRAYHLYAGAGTCPARGVTINAPAAVKKPLPPLVACDVYGQEAVRPVQRKQPKLPDLVPAQRQQQPKLPDLVPLRQKLPSAYPLPPMPELRRVAAPASSPQPSSTLVANILDSDSDDELPMSVRDVLK